jgi:hypothetical protein
MRRAKSAAARQLSSRRVGTAARVAKRLMPIDGNLDGLLDALGQERGRRIHVLPQRFAGRSTSGLWLPTKRADYLVIDEPTTPSRRAAIICHEVAHILLGHTPDFTTSEVIAAAMPDLSPELIARALARHAYATDDEADAEELGTLIGAEHWSRQINSSRLR